MAAVIALVASVLVFVLIVWFGYYVMQRREDAAKRRSLALVTSYASQENVHEAIAAAKRQDSIFHTLMVRIGTLLTTKKSRDRIRNHVLYTGNFDPAAAENVLIRKVIFLLLGILVGWFIASSLGGIWWVALPILAVFGFYVPDLLIYSAGLNRDQEIGKRLPDALDLLNLCVESGLAFQAALGQVATAQNGPVAEEFGLALKEMQLGRSRAQALAAIGARTRQEDMQRFINAMLQVDRLGVPVAAVIREQAKEMRSKRYASAREQAQKVPIKILMPLMLCFLPALFVIILGPAAYSIYQAFS